MSSEYGRAHRPSFPRGLLDSISSVVSDWWYAWRKLTVLQTAPDLQTIRSNAAPDTYGEFLFRTSGVLLHEPSARARAHGRNASLRW
jgi:hypothetical protein